MSKAPMDLPVAKLVTCIRAANRALASTADGVTIRAGALLGFMIAVVVIAAGGNAACLPIPTAIPTCNAFPLERSVCTSRIPFPFPNTADDSRCIQKPTPCLVDSVSNVQSVMPRTRRRKLNAHPLQPQPFLHVLRDFAHSSLDARPCFILAHRCVFYLP